MARLVRLQRAAAVVWLLSVVAVRDPAASEVQTVDDCVRLAVARSPAARAAMRGVDAVLLEMEQSSSEVISGPFPVSTVQTTCVPALIL
jgi:hypothetical protein